MSWSPCFNCKQMVPRYEKYCRQCATKYRQDDTFWKDEKDASTLYNIPQMRERELKKDAITKA